MPHSQTVPWEETKSQPKARGLAPCHAPLSITSDRAMLGGAQSHPVEPPLRHTPHTHAALSDCVMRGNTSTAQDTRVCTHTHKLHSTPLSILSDRAMEGEAQSRPEVHTPYRNSPWSCAGCIVCSCSEFKFHGSQKFHHVKLLVEKARNEVDCS